MKTFFKKPRLVILYRSDFNSCKDNDEERDFFDGLLSQLGIPSREWHKIDSIDLSISSYMVNNY